MTPRDDYAFVGDPPLLRPDADLVHVSCTFTWDIPEARRLQCSWGQYYPVVLGGCACGYAGGQFIPGMYVRHGVTFTSRGCNNHCPWCLVPQREGKIREMNIVPGNIVQDNNLLQCNRQHIANVFDMLRTQGAIQFSGGLDARLLTDSIADDLRALRIGKIFFGCDTKEAIKPLERAKRKLDGFTMSQLRAFVLVAFNNETIDEALERLVAVWELGFMPFVQLYQPPGERIKYSREWQELARIWSRPAISKAFMRARHGAG